MTAQETDQEPSIEEILSSIRQIISDDDEDSAPASVPVAPSPVPQAAKAEPAPEPEPEEVIELTQKIVDDFDIPEPESFEVGMETALEDISVELGMDDDIVPPPVVVQPVKKPTPAPRMESAVDDDSILTKNAAEAALSGFAELARKTAVEHSGVTLEDIVRTELKPLLRDWLDRHLPSMIERLVQEELERVSKRVLEE